MPKFLQFLRNLIRSASSSRKNLDVNVALFVKQHPLLLFSLNHKFMCCCFQWTFA